MGEFGSLGDDFKAIMANIWLSVLDTLPALFIQAGLMAMVNQQWGLGIALLAMGIGGTFVSGYVQGRINREQTQAQEDVSGTQMNAKGRVINTPMSFSQDGQRNVAGEAGWESIMPLTRNADGELGVKAQGGSTEVNVNVHNYAGSDVEVEERENSDGNIDITIRRAVKGVIASGGVDREMRGRYGLKTSRA
jgi:phage-related minor tail protein